MTGRAIRRKSVAPKAANGIPALVAGPAIVSIGRALVVVVALFRGTVEGVTGPTGQQPDTGVAADGVVTALRRQAGVGFQKTLIYVDAGVALVVPLKARFAAAIVSAVDVDALLVALAHVLFLRALVDVVAATASRVVSVGKGLSETLVFHYTIREECMEKWLTYIQGCSSRCSSWILSRHFSQRSTSVSS